MYAWRREVAKRRSPHLQADPRAKHCQNWPIEAGFRQVWRSFAGKEQALLVGFDANDVADPLQERRQVDAGKAPLDLGRLDARQIQDVIDEREQVLPALMAASVLAVVERVVGACQGRLAAS
jgi:hypothetical protein